MQVNFYEIGSIDDSLLDFAVIVSRHQNQWLLCKNQKRKTWELPGGRRESGEAILETAKRELFEETGATEFTVSPICVYSVKTDNESFGMLFFAEITELGSLPESEIEEIGLFDDSPSDMSFPLIQPKLLNRVKEILHI